MIRPTTRRTTPKSKSSNLSGARMWLAAGTLALGMLAFSTIARADATGFPCNVQFQPGASSLGNFGDINFQLYTSAGCTGTFLGSFYIATTGTTIGFNPYNSDQILAASQNLIRAWAASKQVTAFNISTGQNGNVNVANFLSFFR
jgi:hypothetical protein